MERAADSGRRGSAGGGGYVPIGGDRFVTVAEAKPTVRQSFYRRAQVGVQFVPEQTSAIWQAFQSGELAVGAMG